MTPGSGLAPALLYRSPLPAIIDPAVVATPTGHSRNQIAFVRAPVTGVKTPTVSSYQAPTR